MNFSRIIGHNFLGIKHCDRANRSSRDSRGFVGATRRLQPGRITGRIKKAALKTAAKTPKLPPMESAGNIRLSVVAALAIRERVVNASRASSVIVQRRAEDNFFKHACWYAFSSALLASVSTRSSDCERG